MRPARSRFDARPAVIVLLLCLPALGPLTSVPFWSSHDGLHHIFRILDFDAVVRSGTFYPRWAAGLGFGYGFPVTQYYAPLAYFAAEAFHLLGSGILDSIKLVYALGIIISAFGMYRLARLHMNTVAALLAAVVYAYYPYHLADIYMRGTLTEFAALALLPWIIWALDIEILRSAAKAALDAAVPSLPVWRRVSIPLRFSLLLAALILTHNLSAFLFLPVLAGYVTIVTLLRMPERWRALGRAYLRLAVGVCLAFALSAFYWLPALSEVGWIRAGQISASVDDIPSLLTPLAQFVSLSPLQPYVPDAPAGLQHPLGFVVALLSVLALGVVIIRHKALTPGLHAIWWAWLIIALGAAFAMVDLSAPLWTAIQPLAFVQYPYRLHAILSLALAMLTGIGWQTAAEWLALRHPLSVTRYPFIGLALPSAIVILLILSSLGGLTLAPQALPGHKEPITEAQVNLSGMSEYDYQTALWARLYGGPWLLEYLPTWVTAAREEFFLPTKQAASTVAVPVAARISVTADRPEQRSLQVQSASPFRLTFHTFYFPAWQVRIDGAPVPTFPSGPLALVGADVPAGEHAVTLQLEGTPLQRAGELTALCVTLILGVWMVLRSPHRVLWLSGALLLAVGVLGWRTVDVRAADGPQPVTATLDGRIDLIGYDAPHAEVKAGDVAEVTLYWLARQSLQEDFKVFIHVDGSNGRAGQADAQPGFNFSPTTRWQPGEVVADHYRIKLAANAAPGAYTLYAGMYRQSPVQNLVVVSPAATPDNRVKLGTLTVVGRE